MEWFVYTLSINLSTQNEDEISQYSINISPSNMYVIYLRKFLIARGLYQ